MSDTGICGECGHAFRDTSGVICSKCNAVLLQRLPRKVPHQQDDQSADGECPICLEEMDDDDVVLLPCLHALHEECAAELFASGTRECIVCKTKLK